MSRSSKCNERVLWLPCKNTMILAISRPQYCSLICTASKMGIGCVAGLPRTLTKPYVVSGQAKTYCPPSEVGVDSWFAVYKAAWCGLLPLSCSKKTGTQRTKHPDLASSIPGPRLACSRFVSPCPSSSANSLARNGTMAVHRLQHSASSQNTQRPSMLTASLRDPARVSTPKMSSSITKTMLRSVAVILSSRNCCFT
jgi:hypothetical protein